MPFEEISSWDLHLDRDVRVRLKEFNKTGLVKYNGITATLIERNQEFDDGHVWMVRLDDIPDIAATQNYA